MVLADHLQAVVEALGGGAGGVVWEEFAGRPLDNHHIVEVKFDFAVDLDLPEDPVLHHPHEPVQLVELPLELRLTIAHLNIPYY